MFEIQDNPFDFSSMLVNSVFFILLKPGTPKNHLTKKYSDFKIITLPNFSGNVHKKDDIEKFFNTNQIDSDGHHIDSDGGDSLIVVQNIITFKIVYSKIRGWCPVLAVSDNNLNKIKEGELIPLF